jgi:glutamate/tyrosine decarboxylase-like PLP-dependent enzyme
MAVTVSPADLAVAADSANEGGVMTEMTAALHAAYERSLSWLASLPERPVTATASVPELRDSLDRPLPEEPSDAAEVVEQLAHAVEPGLVATPSGRFFGFVIGGALPAALAADWLTSAWDQNAGLVAVAPAEAVVEAVAARWLLELFGLPAGAGVGFVTGGSMASFTCLAAARHHVLAKQGWDVETDGLAGAPEITVIVGDERHVTVDLALRYLGLGAGRSVPVQTDAQARIRPAALESALDQVNGPAIVCLGAGNVNTGAFDPFPEAIAAARARGAWVHVDGAFGLWAAAAPATRHLVEGVSAADSWAVDAHKWLNVPYDSGVAVVAHPEAQASAMAVRASYLIQGGQLPDQMDLVPEFSRRGRGFVVYAALRSLGRRGVADLVERCCAHARRFADGIAAIPGAQILNDVVLNQVLVRFGDDDEMSREVGRRVLQDGTAFMTGTTFKGRAALRISVSNWSTTEGDVDRSLEALRRVAAATLSR